MSRVVLVILYALSAIFTGGDAAEKKIAQMIKEQLPGSVETIEVQIDKKYYDLALKGDIKRITVKMTGMYAKPLTFETVRVELNDLKIRAKLLGKEKVSVEGMGTIQWAFTIRDDEVTEILRMKAKDLRDPQFRFERNRFVLSGKYKKGIFTIPFSVEGYFYVRNEKQVNLKLKDASVANMKVPKFIKDYVAKEVNPLIDVDKLLMESKEEVQEAVSLAKRELNGRITFLAIEKGRLRAEGTI